MAVTSSAAESAIVKKILAGFWRHSRLVRRRDQARPSGATTVGRSQRRGRTGRMYSKETVSESVAFDLHLSGAARNAQVRSTAELRPVVESIEDWMRFYGYPRKDAFAVRLALDEAVAN